LARQRFL
jgi:hypothetical protein